MRGCQQLQPVPPPLFTFELVKWRIPNRNGACSSQWRCGHLRRHVLMSHVGASSCTARVVEFAECDRGCGNTSGRGMGDADVRQSRARTRGRIWVTEQRFRRCRRGRPQAIYQHMGPRRLIPLFHAHLRRDARVTGLRCITRNHTVTLKFSGVIVDFTVCLKPALSHHRPYMATNYMRAATDHVSSRRCADLMRLVVDWAKHKQICPRKRDGYVGNRLKACIWSLLVLAWWTYHVHHGGPDFHYPIELGRMVYEVIRFYAIFPFETLAIAPIVGVAVVEEPFVLRPTESTESHPELVLVCDV